MPGGVDSSRIPTDSRRTLHELARTRIADQDGHGRVGLDPAGREHDQRGQDHARGAQQVGEHVPRRGPDVEAVAAGADHEPGREDVHAEPDHADEQHPAAERVARVAEPVDRLDEDPDGDRDEQDAVRERGEDLRAVEAEAPLRGRRPPRRPRREEREREPARVGGHVPRVREQRERVGERAGDDLDDAEGDDQRERQRERTRPGRAGSAVVVPVRVQAGATPRSRPAPSSRRRAAGRGRRSTARRSRRRPPSRR